MPVQHCHRCAAQVPLRGAPLPWCPHCGGVLSAPVATAPWRTRWVATSPARRPSPPRAAPPGPTPSYASVPRWGLPVLPWRHPLARAEASEPTALERTRAAASAASPVLVGAAVVFVAAAAVDGWRYRLLLLGRTEVLGARTVALSDAAVVSAGLLAPVLALVAAVVCATWLLRARSAAAERAGVRDPRSSAAVLAGVFIPGWNLGQAGVLLTELEAMLTGVAGPSVRVRWWWTAWVASIGLAVSAWGWRALGTAQAEADAVVLSGLADAAAAVCAILTYVLVRRVTTDLTGPDATGPARRWVASVPAR